MDSLLVGCAVGAGGDSCSWNLLQGKKKREGDNWEWSQDEQAVSHHPLPHRYTWVAAFLGYSLEKWPPDTAHRGREGEGIMPFFGVGR